MRSTPRHLVIASRRSLLAQCQARAVGDVLVCSSAVRSVGYCWVESEGDQSPDRSLAERGGKGLFTRAIERAVRDGRADVAVHSLKDLPAGDEPAFGPWGLALAAVPRRGDVRDCLVGVNLDRLDQLPHAAELGTASPRRAAQVRRLRPDVRVGLIRGSVQTRLRKVLEDRRHDLTLMSVAGLQRAGLGQHARVPIDPAVVLPAACQGALVIQCRADDHRALSVCLRLNDPVAAAAVNAERQVVASLGADCHSPIAVLVQPAGDGPGVSMRLRARVLSPDGHECIEVDERCDINALGRVVRVAVNRLRDQGAQQLLAMARDL